MKKHKFTKKIKLINEENFENYNLDNREINLINVNLIFKKKNDYNTYIKNCFDIAFKILQKNYSNKFINGPINKTKFLNNKYLGITEYISKKFNKKKIAMLIYNQEISVCPLTEALYKAV